MTRYVQGFFIRCLVLLVTALLGATTVRGETTSESVPVGVASDAVSPVADSERTSESPETHPSDSPASDGPSQADAPAASATEAAIATSQPKSKPGPAASARPVATKAGRHTKGKVHHRTGERVAAKPQPKPHKIPPHVAKAKQTAKSKPAAKPKRTATPQAKAKHSSKPQRKAAPVTKTHARHNGSAASR